MRFKTIALGVLLFLVMSSLLRINIGYTMLNVYMIFTILLFFIALKYFKINKLYSFEIAYLLVYMYIIVSSLWTIDYALSLKIIIGELILILTYAILRFLSHNITIEYNEIVLTKIFKAYTILSIVLYLCGVLFYYILKIEPSQSMYLNQHSIGIFGLYFEGYMPRFRGLAESPNNYFYISFIVMIFFIYKENFKYALLNLATIVLTLSATGYIILIVVVLYNIVNKKNFIKLFVLSCFFIASIIILYFNNNYIHDILYYRYERILTGSGRFNLWSYVINHLSNNVLFGYGANTSRIILENYFHYQSAHNSILDMFLTTGIIGAIILLMFYIILFYVSLKLNKYYKTRIFISIYIMYFLISMANDTLHISFMIFYLFFIYIYYKNLERQRILNG